MRRRLGGSLRCAALAACALAAACRGAPRIEWDAAESVYTRIDAASRARLAQARSALEEGAPTRAYELVRAVDARFPDHVGAGALRQEIELRLIAAGFAVPGIPPGEAGVAPEELLARAWRSRVAAGEAAPDGELFAATARPSELILAARAETDVARARRLLQGALALDPEAAWAHYGLAHWAVADFDFATAEQALARALELDPGLLPARRLEAHLAERSGDAERAAALLEGWIERAAEDPLASRAELADGWYDRALLALAQGELGDAREFLAESLRAGGPSLPRAEQVAAVLADEVGDTVEALRAARLAEQAAPGDVLPLVQQALIYELRLEDRARAAEAWSRVLALAEQPDAAAPGREGGLLGSLGLRVMAQARLARLRTELAVVGETPAASGDPAEGRP